MKILARHRLGFGPHGVVARPAPSISSTRTAAACCALTQRPGQPIG
jgi:hypothetical protein